MLIFYFAMLIFVLNLVTQTFSFTSLLSWINDLYSFV